MRNTESKKIMTAKQSPKQSDDRLDLNIFGADAGKPQESESSKEGANWDGLPTPKVTWYNANNTPNPITGLNDAQALMQSWNDDLRLH